jgi:thioredoxin reductase
MRKDGIVATVAIIGDGPAGLSAALFLAKNGHQAVIYGQDETPMHYAQLFNYLGIREINGNTFQETARAQVLDQGADLRDESVESISAEGGRFTVHAGDGTLAADYIVLAGGKRAQRLARELGAEVADGRVRVDTEYRTGIDRVYAAGRVARPERSQAIISAGAGATAALDILAREAGKDVHDWDTPEGPA